MKIPQIRTPKNVYEPREDSYILARSVEKYAKGNLLDLGTGSGIQGITAGMIGCNVIFSDIDQDALTCAKANAKANGITGRFIISDMFESVEESFDTIIFNPPYLPSSQTNGEPMFDGGIDGRKFIDKFLKNYKKYLNKDGIALLLESSFNNFESDIAKYKAEIIAKEHYFFEDLVVLLLR